MIIVHAIDLIEPTVEEDRKVQEFVGVRVPTKADPDYTEPPEAHYSENGVRYLHALFISEPEDTPDVTASPSSLRRPRSSPYGIIRSKRSIYSRRSSARLPHRRCLRTRWHSA